eukprot:169129_1
MESDTCNTNTSIRHRLSLQQLVNCLKDTTQLCGYLHEEIAKRIESIVYDEYDLTCPKLVSLLISKLANTDQELHSILRKLVSRHYYNKFFGFESCNYRTLRTYHASINGLIFTDYLLACVPRYNAFFAASIYLFNIIFPIPHIIYYQLYRKNYTTLINTLHTVQNASAYRHENEMSYYRDFWYIKKNSSYNTRIFSFNTCRLYSVVFDARAILFEIIPENNTLASIQSMLNGLSWVTVIYMYLQTFGVYKNKTGVKYYAHFLLTRALMNNSNSIYTSIFQLTLNILSLIKDIYEPNYRIRCNYSFMRLYFYGRLFFGYSTVTRIIDNFIPSWNIHFGDWTSITGSYSKLCGLICCGLAYFSQLGESTYFSEQGESAISKKPRDIYESIYCLVESFP